jgi:alpha-tubulin suppressor-like RCC1 family protein
VADLVPHGAVVGGGERFSLAVRPDGTVAAWGCADNEDDLDDARSGRFSHIGQYPHHFEDYGQTVVPAGLDSVVAVSGGAKHSLALRRDGTIVAWGSYYGGTVVPDGLDDVIAVAASDSDRGCNLALRADGTVVEWGHSGVHEVSALDGLDDIVAVSAGVANCLALRRDGTVVAWGHNWCGAMEMPAALADVAAVASGLNHNLVLRRDGTVLAWGDNFDGQTDVPDGLRAATPDDIARICRRD